MRLRNQTSKLAAVQGDVRLEECDRVLTAVYVQLRLDVGFELAQRRGRSISVQLVEICDLVSLPALETQFVNSSPQ